MAIFHNSTVYPTKTPVDSQIIGPVYDPITNTDCTLTLSAIKTYTQNNPGRAVTTTTDTPTAADIHGLIVYTSSSAVTVTANNLGIGNSYSIMQQGTGQATVAAGSGVTLVSDKSTPSFTTARRGAVLTVIGSGSASVFVIGNTA